MSFLRLGVCCGGVYSMFLLWAIAQERLSVPFPSSIPGHPPARFKSILTLQTVQALFSALFAFLYLLVRRPASHTSLRQTLGLSSSSSSSSTKEIAGAVVQTSARGLLSSYAKVALLNTSAGPFGFASLRHISYPTMVLGKSCKLVPVLFMNVLLYRRRFPPHKYLVVSLVTLGISLFMLLGSEGPPAKHTGKQAAVQEQKAGESLIGLGLLVVNLLIDGATNSGQDEIFRKYRVTGQQMMFFMSSLTLLISLPLILFPLPRIPVLHPSPSATAEVQTTLAFLSTHPSLLRPLIMYALTGALGQLFIFETLEAFGSLTLVMITVTRKLFTMILSVVLFDHQLTTGQWLGAAVVFSGIGVEAWAKISEDRAKKAPKLSADFANGRSNGQAASITRSGNGNGIAKEKSP